MFKHGSRFLRFITWSYLVVHGLLWWKPSINMPLALFFIILTYAVGLLPVRKFFPWKRIMVFVGVFVLISFLLLEADLLLFSRRPITLVRWHFTLLPLAPFLLYFLISTVIFERNPLWQRWEIFLKAALMLPLFWGMSGYRLVFYAYAWQVIYGVMLYLVAENMLLYLLAQQARVADQGWRKKVPVGWVLLSLLGAGHLFFAVIMFFHNSKALSPEGLLNSTGFHFDFSDNLSLEPEISLNPRLLFLARFDRAIEQPMLIKRLTMSGYNEKRGFHWDGRVDDEWQRTAHSKTNKLTLLAHRSPVLQEYYFLQMPETAQLSLYDAQKMEELAHDHSGPFTSIQRVLSQEFKRLHPLVKSTTSGHYFAEDEKKILTSYSANAEILQLALRITAELNTPYAKAQALESYFHNNFFYSLFPGLPPKGTDSLTHFLFNRQQGYCSYFAVSMTLMARMVGLPARIAGGFKIDNHQQTLGFYAVQANQAHTWVEIYFDGVGWLPFDPTSPILSADELFLEVDPPNDLEIYNLLMAIEGQNYDQIAYNHHSLMARVNQKLTHLSIRMRLLIGSIVALSLITSLYTALRFWQFHHWARLRIGQQSFAIRAEIEFLQTKWQLLWANAPEQSWQTTIYEHKEFYRLYQEMLFMPYFTAQQAHDLSHASKPLYAIYARAPWFKRLAVWYSWFWMRYRGGLK